MPAFDHIVIGARNLDEGGAFIEQRLGVRPPLGGEHVTMGTHNLLMALQNGVYLEVIAVDPDARAPSRKRWFALDDPEMQAALTRGPRLIAWAASVDDLSKAVTASSFAPGVVQPMSRGALDWRITIRDDGGLPRGGLAPVLIEWPKGVHPSQKLADNGCRLESLRLVTKAPAALKLDLASVGADGLAAVELADDATSDHLAAIIETPAGKVTLV